ncbi:hypothetical protein BDW22DRAFT_1430434 [Trametopsis cervina]|nr:hypothetical protein BDW22DRAFT_1430434 [Trametopsis cervina]
MATTVPSLLDVQHAVEQAVGHANNTASISKKKSKKRTREQQDGDVPTEEVKKKKKKSKTREEHGGAESRGAGTSDAVEENGEMVENARRKEKGKQRAEPVSGSIHLEPQAPNIPPTTEDDFAASSADFLSAVVEAASATSHIHAGPSNEYATPMPPYPDSILPYSQGTVEYPFDATSLFNGSDGLPDLSMLSSEYFLQTLQNLDISQLASVLKTLGDTGASFVLPSLHIPPSFIAAPPPPGPPPVKQSSAKSAAILGRNPKQVKASGQSTRSLPAPTLPVPAVAPDEGNPEHAHMLANVWMNASKLAQMVETQGLVYKKGKFSSTEEAQLNEAIDRYKATKGMSQQDLVDLIFSKDRVRGEAFWQEITAAIHLRPIVAVYHHVRRKFHPLANLGKWMAAEDESLRSAVLDLGQQWQKVSERVGRSAQDCRDRYRNHLENSNDRRSGPWTKEEEEELTAIVNELKTQRGEVSDNDIFWGAVSQRMGGRRGRQQCRIKWIDSLSSKLRNDGAKPRWSQLDAYILVHKVDSLNVRDDTEIDWKTLPDEDWNMWSAHALQRRWLTMKRSVKGYRDMSHAELMDILRTKKAQSPPPPAPSRGTKKNPRSAETVEDSDGEHDGEHDGASAPAVGAVDGSSQPVSIL